MIGLKECTLPYLSVFGYLLVCDVSKILTGLCHKPNINKLGSLRLTFMVNKFDKYFMS